MNRITDELLVSRSEHHEGSLNSLEEVSLHQQHLTRIEYINRVCAKLKILYLQDNCIAKIENLRRLRSLENLNLSLNNIEVIENVECCESLQDLDLTLNFIGDLTTSIENLMNNRCLRRLHLLGNPCTEFPEYRKYVVASLPWLQELDGKAILRSERVNAKLELERILPGILQAETEHQKRRAKEKALSEKEISEGRSYYEDPSLDEAENRRRFYASQSRNTPEYRLESSRKQYAYEKSDEKVRDPFYDPILEKEQERKKHRRLFADDGRPLNINEAKIDFYYDDTDSEFIVVEMFLYKHLCPTELSLDVEPNYLRCKIKDKLFQLQLFEEVRCDAAEAARSQATGHLKVTMPRVKPLRKAPEKVLSPKNTSPSEGKACETLEVGISKSINLKFLDENGRLKHDMDEPPPLEEITEEEAQI